MQKNEEVHTKPGQRLRSWIRKLDLGVEKKMKLQSLTWFRDANFGSLIIIIIRSLTLVWMMVQKWQWMKMTRS